MTRLASSMPRATPCETNQMVRTMNTACQNTCRGPLSRSESNSSPMAGADCPLKLSRPDSTT